MKNIWPNFVRGAFRTLLVVLRFVPWKSAGKWGESVGSFFYGFTGRYRAVADKNLQVAYGDELTAADRERIIRGVYRNFGRSVFEFLKAPYLSADDVKRLVPLKDFGVAQELYDRGKGLIVITAHLGNFELVARRVALEGHELLVVARASRDSRFNSITDHIRLNAGYVVHARGGSTRPLLQKLRGGGAVAILPDQKSDDVFVPFFGRPAGTVAGPAILALKTGAPIVPIFCPIQPDGSYRIVMGDEINTQSTGDQEANVKRIMTDINCAIETIVRQYPDQWLWLHDRWLVRPPRRRGRSSPPPVEV